MKTAIFITIGVVVLLVVAWFIAMMRYRARMQHYIFAHQLLPGQMFADPMAVLLPMLSGTGFSEEGRQHLLEFWEAAGEGHTDKDLVSPDALTYSMEVLGHPNSTAYFVQMPPPEKKTEAFFVLMVYDAPGMVCGTIRHLRYFVLEYYGEKNGVTKTQLGEWTPTDKGALKYADHGMGTPPDKASFMARVEEIIHESGSQPEPAAG